MIAYDLMCANGHSFEGWFEDGKSFERQKQDNLIACPFCNDTSVQNIPSRFGIKTGVPLGEPKGATPSESFPSPQQIVTFLEENFENVGGNFAKEALKMHYEVSEKRNIRGTSTQAEEKTLEKEGIKFFKIPLPRLDS